MVFDHFSVIVIFISEILFYVMVSISPSEVLLFLKLSGSFIMINIYISFKNLSGKIVVVVHLSPSQSMLSSLSPCVNHSYMYICRVIQITCISYVLSVCVVIIHMRKTRVHFVFSTDIRPLFQSELFKGPCHN